MRPLTLFSCPLLLWTLIALVDGAQVLAQPPVLKTITIEDGSVAGTFDDWFEVLANPANTSVDGPGDTATICTASLDGDCPIGAGPERDIYRVAWTYDSSFVYLYGEFTGSGSGMRKFFFVADTDGPSDMVNEVAYIDPGDRVVEVDVGGGGVSSVKACSYEPSNPSCTDEDPNLAAECDPLNDPTTKLVDGHDIAGKIGTICDSQDYSPPTYQPNGADTSGGPDSGRRFEVKIPWAALNVAGTGPLPLNWHVTVNNQGNRALAGDDNSGGGAIGDWLGTLGFGYITLRPASQPAGAPEGGTASYPFTVQRIGPPDPKVNFSAVSNLGLRLEFNRTSDNALMATDANGDGDFLDPGDFVTPGFDTDGDNRPDTVTTIAAGGTFGVTLKVTTTSGLARLTDTTVLSASASGGQSVTAEALTHIGPVALVSSQTRSGLTGGSFVVPYALTAYNHSGASAVINVTTSDILGDDGPFPVAFRSDLNCDEYDSGPGEGPLSDTNRDGLVDVGTLPDNGSACFVAKVTIPGTAVVDDVDGVLVLASSARDSSQRDTAVLTTRVRPRLKVTPSAYGASDAELPVLRGKYHYFPFTITNNGAAASFSVCLGSTGSFAYPLRLFTDPDSDGSPDDGDLVLKVDTATRACGAAQATWTTPYLAAYGGSKNVILQIEVPPTEAYDTARTHFLRVGTAPNHVDGTVYTRTAKLAAYADAARSRPVGEFAPCDTVYIQAGGLADVNSATNYMLQVGAGSTWASSWRCLKGPYDAGDPYASNDGTCAADPNRPCSVYQTSDYRGEFRDDYLLPAGSSGTWTVSMYNVGRCSDVSETTSLGITVERTGTISGPTSTYSDYVGGNNTGNDVGFAVVLTNANSNAAYPDSALRYAVRRVNGQYWNASTSAWAAYTSLATTATGSASVGSLAAGASVRLDIDVPNVNFPDASETGTIVADWSLPCTDVIAGPGSTNIAIRACSGDLDGDGCTNCSDTDFRITSSDGDGDGLKQHCDCNDANPFCTTNCTDADTDGYCVTTDCNDAAASVHPGATEVVADGVDQDCNARDRCYTDADGDGYGTAVTTDDEDLGCDAGGTVSTSSNSTDCDDAASAIHPGVPDTCDAADNDCDGSIDEDFPCGNTVTETATATPTPSDAATNSPTVNPTPSPSPTIFVAGRVRLSGSGVAVEGVSVDGSATVGGPLLQRVPTSADGAFALEPSAATWVVQPFLVDTSTSLHRGVSSLDATWIQQHLVSARLLTPTQLLAADGTGDGTVSSLDAVRLQELRVKLRARLPVAENCGSDWAFVPVPGPQGNPTPVAPLLGPGTACRMGRIEYASLTGSASEQDFEAVLFGDVTGNWTPGTGGASAALDPVAPAEALSEAASDAEPASLPEPPPCDGPCVAVVPGAAETQRLLGANHLQDVQAFDLSVALPGGIDVASVKQAELATAAGDCSLVWAAKDGTLRISLACLTPIRGGGALLSLQMHGPASGIGLSKCVFDETGIPCGGPLP